MFLFDCQMQSNSLGRFLSILTFDRYLKNYKTNLRIKNCIYDYNLLR